MEILRWKVWEIWNIYSNVKVIFTNEISATSWQYTVNQDNFNRTCCKSFVVDGNKAQLLLLHKQCISYSALWKQTKQDCSSFHGIFIEQRKILSREMSLFSPASHVFFWYFRFASEENCHCSAWETVSRYTHGHFNHEPLCLFC